MQCSCYSERSKSITTQGSPAFQCLWRLKEGVKKRVTPRVNNLFLTRDGKTQLLPVAPDVSSPHSGEASNAGKGGAGQDEGPLAPDLYKGTKDSRVFLNLEIILWHCVTLKCLQETLPLLVWPVGGVGLRQSIHVVQVVVGGRLLLCCHAQSLGVQLASDNSCLNVAVVQTSWTWGRFSFAFACCHLPLSHTLIIPGCQCPFKHKTALSSPYDSILSKFTKWILEKVKKTKTNVMFGLRPQLLCSYLACTAASQDRCRDSCPLSHPQSWKVHSYPG